MPQNSNLNVSPYFDDFDENKNYQRVLFKPGTPLQARELTTLQSILQNQIEKFGSHFFKEGSMVNGDISYKNKYSCVQINDSHLGIPISEYIDKLVGVKIQGQTSGVIAVVENYITNIESEKSRYTLYVEYISSKSNTFEPSPFIDGENLITTSDINFSLSSIRANETFATTILNNASLTGSAVKIEDGLYFIRGFFIKVPTQTIILDQYTNTPSYRVGLNINEEFAVASNNYDDLYDNASGFSNFAAPGADRLIIAPNLVKKDINDFIDENFIELIRVRDGVIEKFVDKADYNLLGDELARRTYDESGDYYIDPFKVSVRESLNDRLGNRGLYLLGENTRNGNTPSSALSCVSISKGKAYVKGYEVETSNVILDLEKPRTTAKQIDENLQFDFGEQIIVNNVYGSIPLGYSDSSKILLYNKRTEEKGSSNGNLIGVSRVYNYETVSSAYVGDSTEYYVSLYDTQIFTEIEINSNVTLTTPVYIEGKTSGASGFLYQNVTNNKKLLLYDVSGKFNRTEQIIINGSDDISIGFITNIIDYNISDVHQIVANEDNSEVGTFTADTVLNTEISLGNSPFKITEGTGDDLQSTISSSRINFNILKVSDIISYTKPDDILPTYNRVVSINQENNSFVVEPVANVTGVCIGTTPEEDINSVSISKLKTKILNKSLRFFTELSNKNISNVDLSKTTIKVRKTFSDINISTSSFTYVLEDPNLSFEAFDEENYNLTFSDSGTVVPLLEFDNITFSSNRKEVVITGLDETGPAIFTATCSINSVSTRPKTYNRCSSLVVNGSNTVMSGSGGTTLDDGLTYKKAYGTRVQDKEISLNIPDVNKILGIYESSDKEDPKLPTITFNSNISSSILNARPGEKLIGLSNDAVGYFVRNLDNNLIEYVNSNESNFSVGEKVLFEESGIIGVVEELSIGSKNITNNYKLDDGYRRTYLDFSRIKRISNAPVPNKKIVVIFNNYTISNDNSGDFVTVNSYDADRYDTDLPKSYSLISSDIIDLRPVVLPYTGNKSPFESASRTFIESSNSSPHIFSRNSNLNISYDYYLPRIDKLFLYKNGNFVISKGIPGVPPIPPEMEKDAIQVATLNLPAYLRDSKDVVINLNEYKRYTMADISKLEDKINRLEEYTLLSLLEQDMKNLVIRDEETKLNKFKSGFFVDNFKSTLGSDLENSDFKSLINTETGTLQPSIYDVGLDLIVGSNKSVEISSDSDNEDIEYDFDLGSTDVKRVGDVVCLNYGENEYTKNIFATRVTNINSFNNFKWTGLIKLVPSKDRWSIKNKDPEEFQYMRSRNIKINARRLKPNTRFYAFFNDIDVTKYIVPKLIEVKMESGVFTEGEVVSGTIGKKEIRFRLAPLNHKNGPVKESNQSNLPENYNVDVYENNIYSPTERLSKRYSRTSTLLNVNINSLTSSSNLYGSISVGMRLVGSDSKAVAVVDNLRLISDDNGSFIGSFFIPDPTIKSTPKFEIGSTEFVLTTSKTNSDTYQETGSYAYSPYISEPRTTSIEPKIEPTISRSNNFIIKRRTLNLLDRTPNNYPLAQTFLVDEDPGIFITKCDIFFSTKDDTLPITIQLRKVEYGIPTQEILPYSEVTLDSDKVNVSKNGRSKTTFFFESPVYLEGGKQYAIVLLTSSSQYNVWISKMGEVDITTENSPERDKIIVSQQPSLGVLYKSQNTSSWTPYQDEDLKFTLYRANFTSNRGTVKFYNPDLNIANFGIPQLDNNPIFSYSRRGSIVIGKTFTTSDINNLIPGATIRQTQNSYFRADLVGIGGSIAQNSSLDISDIGVGFGNRTATYNNVDLISLTGFGNGAKATISVAPDDSIEATITQGGSGYSPGDILKINTNSTAGLGKDLVLTVPNTTGIIGNYNTLFLDNIQGNINVNTTSNIICNDINIQSSPVTSPLNVLDDGLHIRVLSENHGMYSYENVVNLAGIEPDTSPTKLTKKVNISDTEIYVSSVESLLSFENLLVSQSNPGYVLINNEIIKYTGVNTENNTLTGVIKDANNFSTSIDPLFKTVYYNNVHSVGDNVYKYEFNGISLRRINTTHNLSSIDTNKYPITIDSYHIKIDTSASTGKDRISNEQLYFKESKSGGKSDLYGVIAGAKSSKNIMVTSMETNVSSIKPKGTNIVGRIRTISGTSVDGNEASFVDLGYQNISLESTNSFNSPRIIASRINETQYLGNLPGKKSLTLELTLSTDNKKVSPIIDLTDVSILASSNRLNSPVSDYGLDDRINLVGQDPHAAVYVSNLIRLEKPADDLRVLFDAYKHSSSDIRVAYRLISDNILPEKQVYELFPGYRNLDEFRNKKGKRNNDGSSDFLVTNSISLDDYKSYEYTAKNIPDFTAFQIKIMMSGVSQSNIPLIKNFRVIASS